MSILRRRLTSGFTTVPTTLLNDSRLSFRARGVLAYLLTKPDGWQVRAEQIARDGKEGRDAIRAALRELERHGYYRRFVVAEGRDRLATVTEVADVPQREWLIGDGKSGSDVGDGLSDAGNPGPFVSTISKEPPNPREAGGCAAHEEPVPNCRGCGTNVRALRERRFKSKPPHCGECDERTRLIEGESGSQRCPRCHPLVQPSHGTAP